MTAMNDSFRFTLPEPPDGAPVSSQEAERLLRQWVSEHPAGSKEQRDALWQLMRFLGLTGRHAEGLEILARLLSATADPEERAEIALAMGSLMEQAGDFQSAIDAYSRGVSLEPIGGRTWYLLHNNLGFCLNHFGRHSEAETWCTAAIRIDPLQHNAYKNLALALQGQGRFADAARLFLEAVHREAGDPRALAHLEAMFQEHPEIADEIPNLPEQISQCRVAVETARRAVAKRLAEEPPESSAG